MHGKCWPHTKWNTLHAVQLFIVRINVCSYLMGVGEAEAFSERMKRELLALESANVHAILETESVVDEVCTCPVQYISFSFCFSFGTRIDKEEAMWSSMFFKTCLGLQVLQGLEAATICMEDMDEWLAIFNVKLRHMREDIESVCFLFYIFHNYPFIILYVTVKNRQHCWQYIFASKVKKKKMETKSAELTWFLIVPENSVCKFDLLNLLQILSTIFKMSFLNYPAD